jgi:hypothetical protein
VALMQTFTDSFPGSTLNATNWGDYGTVSVSGGQCGCDATTGESGIYSQSGYTLTASYLLAKITPYTGGTGPYAYFQAAVSSGDGGAGIGYSAGNIYGYWISSTGTQTNLTSITYNATSHAWWRIREASGTTYMDTAPDGVTWTNRWSVTDPSGVSYTSLLVQFGAGISSGTAGNAYIADVNISTALTGAASLTVTPSETAAASRGQKASASLAVTPGIGAVVTPRNQYTWPFSWNSIWNMPVSTSATYATTGITVTSDYSTATTAVEYCCTDPAQPVKSLTNAMLANGSTGAANVYVPSAMAAAGQYNMCAAFLSSADGSTVYQGQTLDLTAGSNPSFGGAADYTVPVVSITGTGASGPHGGSGLSALGGTLTVADLTSSGPITHAMKVMFNGLLYYSSAGTGYTWPATSADYGYNISGNANYYGGSNAYIVMGSLLALPPAVSPDKYADPLVQRIATAMQCYGAYIVDNTASGAGNSDAVLEINYDAVSYFTGTSTFSSDFHQLLMDLEVITNNTASTPGGGAVGTARLAPYAPPFENGTGAPPVAAITVTPSLAAAASTGTTASLSVVPTMTAAAVTGSSGSFTPAVALSGSGSLTGAVHPGLTAGASLTVTPGYTGEGSVPVPAYSGSSYPYWMTIQGNGSAANAGAYSENIPVTAGTSCTFTVNVSYTAAFSGGTKIELSFYTASNSLISTVTATSGAMSAGQIYTVSTTATSAPSGSSYAVAQILANGTPSSANILNVYSAAVTPSGAVPVNVNYAFTWTFWPWTAENSATLTWQADQFLLGNTDSLVVGQTIEMMGGAGGVPCQAVPQLLDANGVGPRYRILAPPSLNSAAYGYESSYDLNAPQPTQDVVASMLLDGERPFGYRASNRTITLPVVIFGTLAGGMKQVLAAREYLMSVIDQQVFQITWTPADTGKPLIYDCFRALPSVPLYGFNYSAGGSATNSAVGRPNAPLAMITLTIQALPYGRSDIDGIQTLAFTNSLVNGPVPPGAQVVDNFSSFGSGAGWVQDTSKFVQGGTASVRYDAPVPVTSPYPAAVYSKTLASAVSLTNLPALAVYLGQAYDTQWAPSPSFASNVTLAWTLTDGNGRTLSFSSTSNGAAWGAAPTTPKWTLVTAVIPQGNQNFSYGNVTAYSVTVTNWTGSGVAGLVRMHVWLNDLVAVPQTVANQASPRGILYNLFGNVATARGPVNVQCQLPASAPVVQEITSPASGNWIVPQGVYQVEAEAWGGGGAGGTTSLSRAVAAGGGGGAEYAAEPALNVVPGTSVPYALGAGGTPAQAVNTVADFTASGLSHWTCPANVTSVLVECWGGGAAGAAGSGGGGAGGYSANTETVVPGTVYYISVGAGGKANTGTTSADNAARVGGNSWFGTSSATSLATALVGASGGNTSLTGSTAGGQGATNSGAPAAAKQYPGGNGGTAPGGGGGGGGGAAGAGGAGGPGSAPPANEYGSVWSGSGQGGSGNGQGGGGGYGAAAPGTPSGGSFPGGGGGGGFAGSYFQYAVQSAQARPGNSQVNYMGANGANGQVQLTYAIGGGSPVNGASTTFGSSATTGTVVTAHGGTSALANSAAGGAGGTGSTNTAHQNGGPGGLYLGSSQSSWMLSPSVTNLFQTLVTPYSYSSTTHTSSASSSSCAYGAGVVLVQSTAPVYDLTVTDSAGNVYLNQGQQGGGSGEATGCVYAFAADLAYPVTTSTTLTTTSATSQEYGVIWYASPYLLGSTGANTGSGYGTGTAVSGSFGTSDNVSAQYELVVAFNATNQTFGTPTYGGKLWYAPGSSSSLVSGSLSMEAYVGLNQGGGTGSANGDAFALTLGGSSSWAVLCLPLLAASQQAYMPQLDWRAGTAPGASTTWGTAASISAEGIIAVVGMAGSGSSITAGPSAFSDQGGNHYTVQNTTLMPSSGGVMFLATAPVTAAMAQGASGTVSWGHASAAPEYWTAAYWFPNATGIDGVSAVTGNSGTPSLAYTPNSSNPMAVAVLGSSVSITGASGMASPWNYIDGNAQSYLAGETWACQVTDRTAVTAATTQTSDPWGMLVFGLTMNVRAGGGGAAGGPGNAGYPATFYGGAPGYAGGGKGGQGAQAVNAAGQGAALPGGGGGGSYGNSTTAVEGGQGGQGAVRITYEPPLTPFNTLVVHRPGQGAAKNLNPLLPIPITDVPNNTEYTVPNVIQPNLNAQFNSTYSVILVNNSWNPATLTAVRTITMTISQY